MVAEARQLLRRGAVPLLVITILAAALFAWATPSNSQSWTATWIQKAYPAGSPNGPGPNSFNPFTVNPGRATPP